MRPGRRSPSRSQVAAQGCGYAVNAYPRVSDQVKRVRLSGGARPPGRVPRRTKTGRRRRSLGELRRARGRGPPRASARRARPPAGRLPRPAPRFRAGPGCPAPARPRSRPCAARSATRRRAADWHRGAPCAARPRRSGAAARRPRGRPRRRAPAPPSRDVPPPKGTITGPSRSVPARLREQRHVAGRLLEDRARRRPRAARDRRPRSSSSTFSWEASRAMSAPRLGDEKAAVRAARPPREQPVTAAPRARPSRPASSRGRHHARHDQLAPRLEAAASGAARPSRASRPASARGTTSSARSGAAEASSAAGRAEPRSRSRGRLERGVVAQDRLLQAPAAPRSARGRAPPPARAARRGRRRAPRPGGPSGTARASAGRAAAPGAGSAPRAPRARRRARRGARARGRPRCAARAPSAAAPRAGRSPPARTTRRRGPRAPGRATAPAPPAACAAAVSGSARPRLGHELLEASEVELAGLDAQHVARRRGWRAGPLPAACAAATRRPARSSPRGRRRGPPELVDQAVGGDELVRLEQQQGEQRALPDPAERERPVLLGHLQRPKQAKVHPPASRVRDASGTASAGLRRRCAGGPSWGRCASSRASG